jgi:hypothetical protein
MLVAILTCASPCFSCAGQSSPRSSVHCPPLAPPFSFRTSAPPPFPSTLSLPSPYPRPDECSPVPDPALIAPVDRAPDLPSNFGGIGIEARLAQTAATGANTQSAYGRGQGLSKSRKVKNSQHKRASFTQTNPIPKHTSTTHWAV